jgi:pimeloyl-ACP methyl ester carboxylesterase
MLYHETTGSGPPIAFVHAGIADGRMWDPQWAALGERYRLLRMDLPGFGRSPIERPALTYARDVAALLDELGDDPACLVGASMGGRVALEVAVARPDLVRALVLVAAGLPGTEWSEAVAAYGDAEDEAVSRGDLDGATELNLRMWVDGPHRRPDEVDPAVRAAVAEMQREAFELQAPEWERLEEDMLVPDVADRLGDVRAPTLVVLGELDVDEKHRTAERFAAEIPDARLVFIPDAAHLPSLERPEVFDDLVLEFLARV